MLCLGGAGAAVAVAAAPAAGGAAAEAAPAAEEKVALSFHFYLFYSLFVGAFLLVLSCWCIFTPASFIQRIHSWNAMNIITNFGV
jgi:small neutral amino acid transporter SnatA (MarC family)